VTGSRAGKGADADSQDPARSKGFTKYKKKKGEGGKKSVTSLLKLVTVLKRGRGRTKDEIKENISH